jgi:hypothetical protein
LIVDQYFILISFIKARSAFVSAWEVPKDDVWISSDFTFKLIVFQVSDAKSAEKLESKQ